MSGQNPMEGEGDWGDPVPPPAPPPLPPSTPRQPSGSLPQGPPAYPQQQPPPYQQPGYPAAGYPSGATAPVQPKIDNFLIPSILVTLFCCLPTGVVGIVFASQVNTKLSQGDVAGARAAAGKARLWTFISIGAGLTVIIGYVILAALASSSSSP